MKLFDARGEGGRRIIRDAMTHAEEGGQALHVWDPESEGWPKAPQVFRRNRPRAHLFDCDLERLEKTAKKLGVHVIEVGRFGRKGQHVDLCGKPLERAMASCGDLL